MSPLDMETFEVSTPAAPPGFPRLFRARLDELGPGTTADRDRLEALCGSASAANHFLAEAADRGALVPVAWGTYRVAGAGTLGRIARIDNAPLQRFVSWARELPDLADGPVLFVAPWIWRDTDLNVTDPMPLLPLDPDQRTVAGAPPQWDAFHMDLAEPRTWRLRVGDDDAGTFRTPGPLDAVLILRASLDPRWEQAAEDLGRATDVDAEALTRELDRLEVRPAPRGNQGLRLVAGPPVRRRLLVPPWYLDKVTRRIPAQASRRAVSRRSGDPQW